MMSNTTELSKAKQALLAKYARGRLPQSATVARVIPRRAEGSIIPLSFGQQQMWLLSQLIPDSPVYNENITVRLPGPLNVAAFEQSFNELIRRHEAWRTSFPSVAGQPVQMIHPHSALALPVVDLRYLPRNEREAEATKIATAKALLPFDLAQGPLLRATLMRLDDEDHRLYLNMHHIIFDGISVYQVFLSELRILYEAFAMGKPSPLPELPIQYADFAVWQREQLQANVLNKQLDYWKRQLEEAPESLELSTDRSRPLSPTYSGSRCPVALPKQLTDALRALSRQEGCTLYIVLMAAFKTLLFRYTGQDDILVGTATGGRNLPEVQKLLGVFINMLVMRTHLAGNLSFRQLLARVREETLEAHAHQDMPFEYLVKALQPERALGHNPFFQALFMLEPPVSVLPSGWTLTHMDVKTNTSKFDLSLILQDRPEGLVGFFEYSTDLFDAVTIIRMARHWETLLEGIVADPELHLAELPLLTEVERQQLLVEWNDMTIPALSEQGIHQLFEAQVKRTPQAVALVLDEQQLTYCELNMRANQLAHYLQRLGVGPEVLVGICVERSVEMVVGLLAVLKSGGAFVPLDPTYPQDQLAFLLQDSQIAVLLTQQRVRERFPEHSTQIICLDTDWKVITQEETHNLHSEVMSEDLAYVIYTSGSTGRPKGVLIPHGAIALHCRSVTDFYGLTSDDRVLQFSMFSFDAALEQLLPPLLTGARVILRGPEVWSASELQDKIVAFGLTVVNLPTAYWHQVIQEWVKVSRWTGLHSLRLMIVGGDRMLPQYVELWHQLSMTSVRLLNAYGPTETTITATLFAVPRPVDTEMLLQSIPIGRPLAGRTSYILDTYGNPVPIGVAGELHLGGDVLARGYLNRPELTAERFIANPLSSDSKARLYRTGDVARYLPDGNIEFMGRIDHQVKIRGFRIELGEIESVLGQHVGVQHAVVMAREDRPGDKRLVAYLVQNAEQPVSINDVRQFLREKLPAYMMPLAFLLLDFLPLTPNGKLDRGALPIPDAVTLPVEETSVAATSIVQYQLMRIWKDLLDVPLIGIRDNFFDLGGHSLLAARLVARIEQVCGKKITLATLFAGPTIEQLADALQAEEEERDSRTPIVSVQASGSKRPFFYLHGAWNSEAFHCFHLARHFGPDQPFYALAPYHFDGLPIAPTVEEMAAAHLQSVRAVQPEGPYLLGGFCNGGLVAYEMARQLQVQGQKVELLVLIDPADYPILHKLVYGVIRRAGHLMRLGQDKQLEWFLRLRHLYKYMRRERKPENLKAFRAIDPSIQTLLPSVDALRQDNIGIWNWISPGYGYDPYPGKVTLFWAREEPFRGVWRRKATQEKDIEMHVIPGTHIGCLTEHVQALAEELGTCLSEAQATELKESEYSENTTVSVD